MRFAVNIPPFTDARAIVELGVAAERAGWDAVFVWDHLQWDTHLGLDVHDPWALLSAMAVRTERVMLGTGVTPLARRRPWVLAKQIVTLDHLSGGRAVVGIGLGEPGDADFGAFGDEADRAARARLVDEGLPLLDHLLRAEAVAHHGEHYDVEAHLLPRPVQQPRPRIYVAGTYPRRRPLERALRWDGFFPLRHEGFLTPEEIAGYLAGVARPDGWDVYSALVPDHPVADFEAAGVTWLVLGAWPVGDWVTRLAAMVAAGPPA
jgi:alkanesulfonate monooxygenase SsuD/methylene tetrahydromethanopterin reductase-like flavin-dependent oxidoreductase (luciferase family)